MREMLRQFFTSKKGVAFAATAASYAAARFGIDVPLEDVQPIVGLGMAYLLGQGIADHGKGRTLAEAAKSGPLATRPSRGAK